MGRNASRGIGLRRSPAGMISLWPWRTATRKGVGENDSFRGQTKTVGRAVNLGFCREPRWGSLLSRTELKNSSLVDRKRFVDS